VVLPKEHIVQFYSSPSLKQWTHLSDFGPAGDINDIWECPSLTTVPVENSSGATKWVLFNSQQTTMQYFVGEFDGTRFTNENPPTKIFRPDYGPDYYAAITYNHLPAHHMPVLLGWANNWKYANDIPTYPWKSAMSLPRQLSLKRINNEWILVQQPVLALQQLRTNTVEFKNMLVTDKRTLPVKSQQIEIEILLRPTDRAVSGVRLAVGKQNAFVIGYNGVSGKLFIDRSACRNNSFNKNFAALSRYEASLSSVKRSIDLHIFFDKSIVEVFADDGKVVMTAQCFVDENDNGVELFSDGGKTLFEYVRIRQIKSAWK
jgi:fructan beta-fructosidase